MSPARLNTIYSDNASQLSHPSHHVTITPREHPMVRWFDGASAAKLRQIGFFPACVSHGSLSNGGPGVGGLSIWGWGTPLP